MPREIITLQFGPYANHIGAHFWNFQDELFSPSFQTAGGGTELDADVLYRTTEAGGLHSGSVASYTPRLLVFDARNSAGIAQASAAWIPDAPTGGGAGETEGGRGALSRRPPNRQHAFQRYLRELESGAVVAGQGEGYGFDLEASSGGGGPLSWGDYLKALYHPHSLVQLGGRTATGEQLGTDAAAGITEDVPFDAFTMGHGLSNEPLLDAFRRLLEECDRPQGVQAVVDVDAGWGGLAEDVLTAVREEMPRSSMLVLGAVPPTSATSSSLSQEQVMGQEAGGFHYAAKSRAGIRAVNLGLGFSAFGGGDNELGAHFVPLSLQAYADAVAESAREAASAAASGGTLAVRYDPAAKWFPGLGRLRPDSAYHTSALLAAAWDGFLTPLRRRPEWPGNDDLLGCASGGAVGDARPDRALHASGGTGQHGVTEEDDSRSKRASADVSGGGNGHSWFDPGLELDPRQPLVALRGQVVLGDYLALLSPSTAHRISTLSLALPYPHPRASATSLHRALLKTGSPPIHTAGLELLAPLSWTSPLPQRYYGGSAASPDPHLSRRIRPLAHALLLRGVGTHTVSGGRYTSSVDAYGRVLDGVLEASGCRLAGHGAFRTPLPLPLSFPCSLFSSGASAAGGKEVPRYDQAGAALLEEQAFEGAGRAVHMGGQPEQQHTSAASLTSSTAASLPFSVPTLTYVSTGPAYAQALRRLHADFRGRDASILHRFSSVARTGSGISGAGGGQEDLAEVENALAQMADDYAPTAAAAAGL